MMTRMAHRIVLLFLTTLGLGGANSGAAQSIPDLERTLSGNQRRVILDLFSVAADTLAGRPIQSNPRLPCMKKSEQLGFLPNKREAYEKVKKSLHQQGWQLVRERPYDTMQAFEFQNTKKTQVWIGAWILSTSGGKSTFLICQSR